MVPMCVSTCIGRTNYFGDLDDPESLIYKTMKANKVWVLQSVKGKGEAKLAKAQLEKMDPMQIGRKVGYPGTTPAFAASAATKPRVYYILP
jgi:Fe-S-cluster-containing dehydrogenase component